MNKHDCYARGCRRQIPLEQLMCFRHWLMVPRLIRSQIRKHYRPGQEHDHNLSPAYLEAIQEAREAVAAKEAKP